MHAWINITHPGFSGRQEMPDDGDQWVSWKHMVATLRTKGEAEGRAALLAREVAQLRADLAAKDAEIEGLRDQLAEWQTFRDMFADLSYHHSGMGCGIEDRGITDRYAACEHGWDRAMERVAECIPEEIETTEGAKP